MIARVFQLGLRCVLVLLIVAHLALLAGVAIEKSALAQARAQSNTQFSSRANAIRNRKGECIDDVLFEVNQPLSAFRDSLIRTVRNGVGNPYQVGIAIGEIDLLDGTTRKAQRASVKAGKSENYPVDVPMDGPTKRKKRWREPSE